MEQRFTFQLTPLDAAHLRPQVSRALEKRVELVSRQRCPRMWKLTDKLNGAGSSSQSGGRNQRRHGGLLGLMNWSLGVSLLMPGLMAPQELTFPLIVGAVGFGAGTVGLWRSKRMLLGVLDLIAGALLCLGAARSFEQLGRWLPLGLAAIGIGLAALVFRKRKRANSFDREAERLLREKAAWQGQEQMQVHISNDGMTAGPAGEEKCQVLCAAFDFVLETEELLLPVFHDSVVILQKKDLLAGTIFELRELLSGQTQYIRLDVQT